MFLTPALAAPSASATAATLADQIVVRHRVGATPAERADVRHDAGVSLEAKLRLTGVEAEDVFFEREGRTVTFRYNETKRRRRSSFLKNDP